MAETGPSDEALKRESRESTSKKKSNVANDVVAPGEEETSLENHNHDFDRSALYIRSQGSGIQREKWGSKMQFLMSCIASAVGLGNVWRFPAICATNGGATFLIPYVVVLFVIARPLFVLELTLGQFSSKGSVRCWDVSPALTGIGITGMASSVLLSTFYIMLLAWALIYSVIAFISICYQPTSTPLWTDETGKYFGGSILRDVSFSLATYEYPGSVIPVCHLVLALIFAWMIIWITMVFGVEASGKIAYVTALAPYFVLITLMIAGLNLKGMTVGLDFLFNPDISKLWDGNTWFQAVGQCFFSLGIGFGGCIMFSSYNDFHNDIIRDVLIISIVDSVTSILAGISLMSILGFQANKRYLALKKAYSILPTTGQLNENQKKINDSYVGINKCASIALDESLSKSSDNEDWEWARKKCQLQTIIGDTGGAGLAFVHYPAAMNEINKEWAAPVGTILGLLFFLMLILLAVGSANGFVGTTVTIISDKKPKWKRSNIVTGVCAFSCFLGLIYTNGIGSSWFDVVDIHGVVAVVYVLAFLEVFAIVYVYGLKNFCDDVQFMRNGKPPGWYLRITWVTLPPLMVLIYIYWLITYEIPKGWTTAVVVTSWLLTTFVLIIIPATMVHKFLEFRKNPWRRNVPLTTCAILSAIFRPNPRWGPKDPEIRIAWKEYKSQREPSYHIMRKIKALFCKKSEPPVHPSARTSYATNAMPSDSEVESGNAGTPAERGSLTKSPPTQRRSVTKSPPGERTSISKSPPA